MASSIFRLACSRAAVLTSRHQIAPGLVSRALFSSEALVPGIGKGKTSTGIVGLAVDHDAIPKMIEKYQALLDKMAASDMPEDAQYRVDVEKICRFRIDACMKYPDDPDKVEELCNCGQVEELVEQADDEMEVLDMYLRERWWEQLNPNVPIDINPDPEDDEKGVDLEDEEPKEAAK